MEPQPQVLYRDPTDVARKRRDICEQGAEHLQVISDFDYTLSAFTVGQTQGSTCHGVIESCGLLGEGYHRETKALKAHYYPLEVDHSLSHEERVRFMVEWVTKAHALMVDSRLLTKEKVKRAAAAAHVALRPGHKELFQLLQDKKIPLLIFSAGITDVLEELLEVHSEASLPDETHIISNRMAFGDDGALTGFEGTVHHVFNKNAASVMHEPFFRSEEIQKRGNVLLLGDSLGDVHMADGLDARVVLSIGFLNDRVQERLLQYLAAYDVVILNGEGEGAGLDYAVELLRELK